MQHDTNLCRASWPPGVVAVALFCIWYLRLGDRVAEAFAPLQADPAAHWLRLAVMAGVIFYGLASFIVGLRQCWGVRSDGMLMPWALLRLAAGSVGLVCFHSQAQLRDSGVWSELAGLLLGIVSIWCAVVGAIRLVLLTVGGSSAMRQVQRYILQTQVTMRPARARSWWRFW